MYDTYREYLEHTLEDAQAEFDRAKAEAARSLNNIEVHTATSYGAAYYTKIDTVSIAAAKVQALAEALRAYQYYTVQEA